jgi:arginyl-tRNA synthetase
MSDITNTLQSLISEAISSLGEAQLKGIHFEHPAEPKFGDLSTNVAMVSLNTFRSKNEHYSSPRAFAEAIVHSIQASSSPSLVNISRIEVAGPGFINFYFSDIFLLKELKRIIDKPEEVIEKTGAGKKVIVEYSSPNIAKPFTIGHLRTTVIGDSVAHLLEATGWTVFRDNHLGDWGTQFGKQIYAIKNYGDEKTIETAENPVKELVGLYVKFHEEAEKHPEIEDEARAWFKKLEDGDQEARRLWAKCIEWSMKEFNRIYKKLDIHFTENNGAGYGESFFEDKMTPVIAELEQKGLLTTSEGAKLVFFPEDKLPPLMVMKKDGATLYATRDLATDKFRLEHYGKDILVINEVGAEQSLYWHQIFMVEEMLGWYKPGQRVHVKHGLYRFKDKKMSTRKGNVIWLEDVLNEAYQRVIQKTQEITVRKDKPDSQNGAEKSPEQEAQLWKIAIGALRWNDLKREPVKEITFDWDEILTLQGNSGPYIQYTYARSQSVLEKAGAEKMENLKQKLESYVLNEEERAVIQKIAQFNEVVQRSASEYSPHHVATFLFESAQTYNTFYNKHSILGEKNTSEQVKFRMLLTQSVARILQQGLELLGIQTVEKM